MIVKKLAEKIANTACYLKNFHIHDLAWYKETAIEMLNSILSDDIGILGGDVYELDQDDLIPLCDNWSSEPLRNESRAEFYLRSKMESLQYITKYPVKKNETIIFAIVFTYDPMHPELSYKDFNQMMNNYDNRQYYNMSMKVIHFEEGKNTIDELLYDLEALLDALKDADENWSKNFRHHLFDIEQVYADVLFREEEHFSDSEIQMMQESIEELNKLIQQKLPPLVLLYAEGIDTSPLTKSILGKELLRYMESNPDLDIAQWIEDLCTYAPSGTTFEVYDVLIKLESINKKIKLSKIDFQELAALLITNSNDPIKGLSQHL